MGGYQTAPRAEPRPGPTCDPKGPGLGSLGLREGAPLRTNSRLRSQQPALKRALAAAKELVAVRPWHLRADASTDRDAGWGGAGRATWPPPAGLPSTSARDEITHHELPPCVTTMRDQWLDHSPAEARSGDLRIVHSDICARLWLSVSAEPPGPAPLLSTLPVLWFTLYSNSAERAPIASI